MSNIENWIDRLNAHGTAQGKAQAARLQDWYNLDKAAASTEEYDRFEIPLQNKDWGDFFLSYSRKDESHLIYEGDEEHVPRKVTLGDVELDEDENEDDGETWRTAHGFRNWDVAPLYAWNAAGDALCDGDLLEGLFVYADGMAYDGSDPEDDAYDD